MSVADPTTDGLTAAERMPERPTPHDGRESHPPFLVALVGNPNSGKTTLFNALTGHHRRVGHYPGVTVEKKTGRLRSQWGGRPIEVIDLPGTYSLAARSADEGIVLDVLLGDEHVTARPDVIVCVVDATNPRRQLFLATQLLDLERPVIVALNMIDLVEARGMRIEANELSRHLGTPVVPMVARNRKGVAELEREIVRALERPQACSGPLMPPVLTKELDVLETVFASKQDENGRNAGLRATPPMRAELLQALLNPAGFHERKLIKQYGADIELELAGCRRRITNSGESLDQIEARTRYDWIAERLKGAVQLPAQPRRSRSDVADRCLTHPILGLAILLLLMATCFQAIYAWAAPLMDGTDYVFQKIGAEVGSLLPRGAVQSLVVNGVVAGVGAVLSFLPQILILFFFIALVEDCGYLARATLLLDRWMRILGLPGKAFIPLLSSFACAVPGILATRIIEDRRDRFLAILIAPLMSCSARLPVYTLLIAAFVPPAAILGGWLNVQALTLLGMYLVGVVAAVPVAWLLKRTVLKGPPQPFLMELPTYKWPSPSTVFYRVYEQGRAFCSSAGTIIFAVTIVIWALGYYPRPASIAAEFEARRQNLQADGWHGQAQLGRSSGNADVADGWHDQAELGHVTLDEALAKLDQEEAGAYLRQSVLGRLGAFIEPAVRPLGWDWRIGTAVIASFPAREVVIATLGTIYNLGSETDERSETLRAMLADARWPDGRAVFNVPVVLSIMVFFALCCQCGATLATIKRETNSWRWPVFTFTYMTVLAYAAAFVAYRGASYLAGGS